MGVFEVFVLSFEGDDAKADTEAEGDEKFE